jgi:hypothetical protein
MANSSERIRLSIDPRYVPADQPLSWKERVSLAEYNEFYEEAKRNVKEMGVRQGVADKILHVMSVEGPGSKDYDVRSRIRTLETAFDLVIGAQ